MVGVPERYRWKVSNEKHIGKNINERQVLVRFPKRSTSREQITNLVRAEINPVDIHRLLVRVNSTPRTSLDFYSLSELDRFPILRVTRIPIEHKERIVHLHRREMREPINANQVEDIKLNKEEKQQIIQTARTTPNDNQTEVIHNLVADLLSNKLYDHVNQLVQNIGPRPRNIDDTRYERIVNTSNSDNPIRAFKEWGIHDLVSHDKVGDAQCYLCRTPLKHTVVFEHEDDDQRRIIIGSECAELFNINETDFSNRFPKEVRKLKNLLHWDTGSLKKHIQRYKPRSVSFSGIRDRLRDQGMIAPMDIQIINNTYSNMSDAQKVCVSTLSKTNKSNEKDIITKMMMELNGTLRQGNRRKLTRPQLQWYRDIVMKANAVNKLSELNHSLVSAELQRLNQELRNR